MPKAQEVKTFADTPRRFLYDLDLRRPGCEKAEKKTRKKKRT